MDKNIGRAVLFSGLALLAVTGKETAAAPLLSLTVQPIQVCDDGGMNCANSALELFPAETQKIWDQAEIVIDFLPWQSVNSSAQLNEDAFGDLGLQILTTTEAAGGITWFVGTDDSEQLARQEVEVVWRRPEEVLIRGVEPGTRIVTNRLAQPIPGTEVEVVKDAPRPLEASLEKRRP